MNVLSIDTSQLVGSAALSRDGELIGSRTFGAGSSHLVELGGAVKALLNAAGLELSRVDRAAVVSGPGSFTGLRVGMSFVKGLHAASGVEVVTFGSLELLAAAAIEEHSPVSPMIDARKEEVYAALYERAGGRPAAAGAPFKTKVLKPPQAVSPRGHLESLARIPTLFVGSGAVRYRDTITRVFGRYARFAGEPLNHPSTALLCRIAESLDPHPPGDISALEPQYVRPGAEKLEPLRAIRVHDDTD